MKCSIVIPMRNENGNVVELINQIKKNLGKISFEIIAVNDGSTDNTKEILEECKKRYSFLKIIHRKRQNRVTVGEALRDGFKLAEGDIIVTMDGDLTQDPRYIPLMIKKLIESKSDVVIASRFMKGGSMSKEYGSKYFTKAYNLAARILLGIKVKDFTHGFKVFRSKVLKSIRLTSPGFSIYAEIPIKAHLKGFKLAEIPIHYKLRETGSSKLRYANVCLGYSKFIVLGALERIFGK